MLTNTSISKAIEVATRLSGEGKKVKVIPGSFLASLVKDSCPNYEGLTDANSLLERIETNSAIENDLVNHTGLINQQIKELAERFSLYVEHNLCCVLPHVIKFIDDFNSLEGIGQVKTPEELFEVSYLEVPGYLDHEYFKERISSLNPEFVYARDNNVFISNDDFLNEEDIRSTLISGMGGVDEQLAEVYNRYDDQQLKDILIGGLNREDNSYYNDDNSFDQDTINLMYWTNRQAAFQGMENPDQDLLMNARTNSLYWANTLKNNIDRVISAENRGDLISRHGTSLELEDNPDFDLMSQESYKIVVVKKNFIKHREAGGSISSIYSLAVNGVEERKVSVESINFVEGTWMNFRNRISFKQKESSFANVKSRLVKAFLMFEPTEVDGEGIEQEYINGIGEEEANLLIGTHVDKLYADQHIDLSELAIELVAGIRYKDFDAVTVLKNFINEDGYIEVSQAKVVDVVLRTVIDFLVSNIKVV